MRTALVSLGMVVSLSSMVGCGPSPTPVAPTPDKGAKPSEEMKQVAAPAQPTAFDLAPVAEPTVVAMARWKSPAMTMSALSSCSGVSPPVIEGNTKKLADLIIRDVLGGAVDAGELASILAFDAPIDAAVTLETSGKRKEPMGAISFGLVSLERARGALEARERGAPPVEIAPGMWRIGDRDTTDASCVIAASAGGAPARLICGERERDVLAVGPYLARNMPIATFAGGDVHGEVRFGPIVDTFGPAIKQDLKGLPVFVTSQLSLGEPKFDRAVAEAAAGLQTELSALLTDADKVNLDITVDPATCLTGSGSVQLRGKASWLAGTMADASTKAGAPPSIFWQLPKDSDAAFYGRGADPARFTGIVQVLRGLAEGAMNKLNIGTAADRKALVGLLSLQLKKETSSVSASGHLTNPPVDAKKDPGSQQMVDALLRGWLGWTLMGVDEGPETISKALKDFVAAYNRQVAVAAAFDKAQTKEQDAQRDLLKRGKQLTMEDIEAREKKLPPRSLLTPVLDETRLDATKLPTMKSVPAPAALGKGALDIEIKVAGIPSPSDEGGPSGGKKGGKEKIDLVAHLLLMADDKSTWVAIGNDRDELVKRLLSVKASAPATDKLASRASLETLKNGKFLSGGFVTLVPAIKAANAGISFMQAAAPGGAPPEVQEIVRLLGSLPHRGEAPIFFTTEVTGGATPRGGMSFSVSQAVMEDIGALVIGGLKIASRMNP